MSEKRNAQGYLAPVKRMRKYIRPLCMVNLYLVGSDLEVITGRTEKIVKVVLRKDGEDIDVYTQCSV